MHAGGVAPPMFEKLVEQAENEVSAVKT